VPSTAAAAVEGALVLDEVAVPAGVEAVAPHRAHHVGHHPRAHELDRLGAAAGHGVRHVDGHVEAMHRAVGGVVVDREIRCPRLTHAGLQQAHLGRGLAQVVAVEVDAVALGAGADDRAELAVELREIEPAVRGIERVVAVGVEQRRDQERHVLEQRAVGVAVEEIAHQREARLLALDLAGVDAVDDEHHRQPGGPGLGRRAHAARRDHQERQLAPLRAVAEAGDVQPRIAAGREALDEGHHIGVE
jgi:hypothetical protein